ncbi:Uncharacterised protein [Amycolatopsis camponoti]|uniref:CU044_5270 family protein n=1 Tax=Amycolatopsis camponoti TaxID=2606593 RepID=A0A6I8LZ70_9PSEU|nr:hypothetical protein [Amycolatopsis camponoti]VVJ22780.1 Uncharacterised protein [Amycolatopsis camponoti]
MREDNVRKIWSDAELDAALSDLHDDVDEDDGLALSRASLMAAAETYETPPATPRRGTWRWIAVAAAVVALVGGLAVVTSLRTPAPEPAQPAATLADLDRPLEPGEFHYAQKLQWLPESLEGRPAEMQQSVELWIPADPTGIWHRRTKWTGAVYGLSSDEQRKVRVNLSPFDEYGRGGSFPGSPNAGGTMNPTWNTPFQNWLTPDAAFIASLTPDRRKLVKRLGLDTISFHDSGKAHTATESLAMVRSVLETGLVRKDIRFGLRDAFAEITGAFVTPGHTSDGRTATVLIAKDSGQRVFLEPATAQLLAWDAGPMFTPVTPRSEVAVSTSKNRPPSSGTTGGPTSSSDIGAPQATTTVISAPLPPQLLQVQETLYSFAITRTAG